MFVQILCASVYKYIYIYKYINILLLEKATLKPLNLNLSISRREHTNSPSNCQDINVHSWLRCSSGIRFWTPPLLNIHCIAGTPDTGTWVVLPFQNSWHIAVHFISTRWSKGSCTDHRLPGVHLNMNASTTPRAQFNKVRQAQLNHAGLHCTTSGPS